MTLSNCNGKHESVQAIIACSDCSRDIDTLAPFPDCFNADGTHSRPSCTNEN